MLRVGVTRSLAPRLLLPSAPSLPLPMGGARTLAMCVSADDSTLALVTDHTLH